MTGTKQIVDMILSELGQEDLTKLHVMIKESAKQLICT